MINFNKQVSPLLTNDKERLWMQMNKRDYAISHSFSKQGIGTTLFILLYSTVTVGSSALTTTHISLKVALNTITLTPTRTFAIAAKQNRKVRQRLAFFHVSKARTDIFYIC